jgi:hypothetical protein
LENFMLMRRLGDGKYDNQQRLGLGGKGGDGEWFVMAGNGMAVAAAV